MSELTTEEKIIRAAETVFLKSGFDGARMQEIADEAGINKALLHYYFRSKDKLFEKIFNEKFITFFPKLGGLLDMQIPFTEKLCLFVERYIDILRSNPYVPYFIVTNIHKKNSAEILKNFPKNFTKAFEAAYTADFEVGLVKKVNVRHFQISVMSMCIFPFLGKPIIKEIFSMDDEVYTVFLQERAAEIQLYIRTILAP